MTRKCNFNLQDCTASQYLPCFLTQLSKTSLNTIYVSPASSVLLKAHLATKALDDGLPSSFNIPPPVRASAQKMEF